MAKKSKKVVLDSKMLSPKTRDALKRILSGKAPKSTPSKKKKTKSPDFDEMFSAIKGAYENLVLKKNKKYVYKGPELRNTDLRAVIVPFDQALTVAKLADVFEDQRREPIDEVLGAAIQLGMQKGLDIAAQRSITSNEAILTSLEMIILLAKSKKPDTASILRSASSIRKQIVMRNEAMNKELNEDADF